MSLTLHLPLIHRRPKCPPAPPLPVRTGPVCHHGTLNHAVSASDRAAVEAERAAAIAAGNLCLVDALDMRLLECDKQGPAQVTR